MRRSAFRRRGWSHLCRRYLTDQPGIAARLRSTADSLRPGGAEEVAAIAALFPYPFDKFQQRAALALSRGQSVVVSAPTGSGKTAVGEFAVFRALCQGRRAIYTTPVKALSNQKYQDFVSLLGDEEVGILTGDVSVNRDAPLLIVTTEVFRNMVLDQSRNKDRQPTSQSSLQCTGNDQALLPTQSMLPPPLIAHLGVVVLDELHYLADPHRGTIWEETIIHAPKHAQLVGLSGSIPNAQDVAAWLCEVHGDTVSVSSDVRSVPLRYYFCSSQTFEPLLDDSNEFLNPRLLEHRDTHDDTKLSPMKRKKRKSNKRRRNKRRGQMWAPGDFEEGDLVPALSSPIHSRPSAFRVARHLQRKEMLPALYFVFSRKRCEALATSGIHKEVRLVTNEERAKIQKALLRYFEDHPEQARKSSSGIEAQSAVCDALAGGVAAHHAGMMPSWKALLEALFQNGLIKLLFATETMAVGINMPARTVVISELTKPYGGNDRSTQVTDGQHSSAGEIRHVRGKRDSRSFRSKGGGAQRTQLSGSSFLQIAGRAGRRGMDVVGNVVVLQGYESDLCEGPAIAASLALRGAEALSSSFAPSYSLVLSYLKDNTLEESWSFLGRTFGAWQYRRQRDSKEAQTNGRLRQKDQLNRPNGDVRREKRRLEAATALRAELCQEYQGMIEELGLSCTVFGEGQNTGDHELSGISKWIGLVAEHVSLRSVENELSTLLLLRSCGKDGAAAPAVAEVVSGMVETSLAKLRALPPPPAVEMKGVGLWRVLGDGLDTDTAEGCQVIGSTIKLMLDAIRCHEQICEATANIERLRLSCDQVGFATQRDDPMTMSTNTSTELSTSKLFSAILKVLYLENLVTSDFTTLEDHHASRSPARTAGRAAVERQRALAFSCDDRDESSGLDTDKESPRLTPRGEAVARLRGVNELWLGKVFLDDELVLLTPGHVAALCVALCTEERQLEMPPRMSTSHHDGGIEKKAKRHGAAALLSPSLEVTFAIERLREPRRLLLRLQALCGINIAVPLHAELTCIGELWCNGADWSTVVSAARCVSKSVHDGDIVRLLERTKQLLAQVAILPGVREDIRILAGDAFHAMEREPLCRSAVPSASTNIISPSAEVDSNGNQFINVSKNTIDFIKQKRQREVHFGAI